MVYPINDSGTVQLQLLLAIFVPLICSPLFFLLQKVAPRRLGFAMLSLAAFALVNIVGAGALSGWNEPQLISIGWVPSLGINLTFITDGLSLFFGLLVTGMGMLVSWYAQYYMDPADPHLGRFYACLAFFMGAMLGTVFSDNLMVLFLFWELTGAASFLLIGYKHPQAAALRGARMAMLVTALTSLCLLAGIILLGLLAGTYEWHRLAHGLSIATHGAWIKPIIVCFLVGIFGKSAQFPFYFWLPNAMVAPTPVSAYLHAATMVKLGVFLTARLYPLFVSEEIWYYMLTSFSFITLLLGAIFSLLSNDLKAILAYATVSQLGFFLGFYGIGGEEGIEYDFVHILNHAFYKGSLFMLVGIVEHATGIRDVRRLGGLWSKMPLTTFIFFIAAAAMAGIPGTTGFLSKELMLTDLIAIGKAHHSGWVILGVVISASLFKVAISIRIFYHLFVRPVQEGETVSHLHKPSLAVQLPPLLLSSVALLFGILPTPLSHLSSYFYVSGLHKLDPRMLLLWHGWTIEIAISAAILAGGALLFYMADRLMWGGANLVERLDAGILFDRCVDALPQRCRALLWRWEPCRVATQVGSLAALFGVGLGLYLVFNTPMPAYPAGGTSLPLVRGVTALAIGAFTIMVALTGDLRAKLLSLSACGFFVCLYFCLYQAPDLALTQILVEVATSLLILLLFRHLRWQPAPPADRRGADRWWTIPVAAACGLTGALLLTLYQSASRPLLDFFVQNTVPYAHGRNVVNTILIDFRGFDTLGEATVLLTAMLGVIGLLANKRALTFHTPPLTAPTDSIILRAVTPTIFIILVLLSLYLLLRGHDYPGGGFVAGLTNGIALLIVGWTMHVFKKTPLFSTLAFVGLVLMLAAGSLPSALGYPFLTHYAGVSSWPWLNAITDATPLIFDGGVYLVVLGMTAKIYLYLRQAHYQRC